ncbi:MAG: NgoFVII family restriction endonuclease [Candidatus Gastranaerophilales bacterium]
MFFNSQSDDEKRKYELFLRIICSLSKLSSDNTATPYLYYRMAENIFCKAFSAKNLSRSDISIDASKKEQGFGLKTFLHKNSSCLEKVAEFNKERPFYIDFMNKPEELIQKISNYRNKRILTTCGICSLKYENLIYHCITRNENGLFIHEEPMHLIDQNNIKILNTKNNTISFSDEFNEYSFNLSKSTLSKRFNVTPIHAIDVKIFEDPFDLLEKYLSKEFTEDVIQNRIIDTIYLPLYSINRKTKIPYVPEKSGLNQWNASGRTRNANEVYIRIPAEIKNTNPNFFPPRNCHFQLNLPNNDFITAKICQDNDKALMSNPNQALGKWILRDILNIEENKIVTYEKLIEIGIDTVQINKYQNNIYDINFKQSEVF